MYAYIKGEVTGLSGDFAVVEANGIGYLIHIPLGPAGQSLRIGQEAKVYTYLHIKESMVELYGFLSEDDLEIFKMMLGVSGIGPKGALAVLSVMTPDELRLAILSGDAKAIAKAQGIGGKTAQRLILELRDKVSAMGGTAPGQPDIPPGAQEARQGIREDARLALEALGYSPSESAKAVSSVTVSPDMTVERLLKEALRQM